MRQVIWSKTFSRGYERTLRKHPDLERRLETVLTGLVVNPFADALETHKLKGKLKGAWACSAGHDLRILFDFCKSESSSEDDILLINIGTHDDVY